ncbi:Scr1 family TA system antitoxin-like transcriptional regulator [Amycolatopsis magusensis]|uniref:Scr1 family TA system antitoxin-like transcriptional regulator n=1 Tax=Amycolatopsis magusensis TaxID=882444 RepID=UPI0034D534BA
MHGQVRPACHSRGAQWRIDRGVPGASFSEEVRLEQLRYLRYLTASIPQLELRLVPLGTEGPLLGERTTLYFFRPPAPPRLVTEGISQSFIHRSARTVRDTGRAFSPTKLRPKADPRRLFRTLRARSRGQRPWCGAGVRRPRRRSVR